MIPTRLHFPEGSGLNEILVDQEWPSEGGYSLPFHFDGRWFAVLSIHLELIEGGLVRFVHLCEEGH